MNNEKHPWMKGFTITTLITGILAVLISFSVLSDSNSVGGGLITLLIAGLMIWGSIWLLNISEGFKKWSTLSGSQQLLGCLIMFVGAYAGVALFVILIAIKVELGRHD